MSEFEDLVADLTGVQREPTFNKMPNGLTFDGVGSGFPDVPLKSAILCTARSGSSLLSVALQAYKFDFHEYLNTGGMLKTNIAQNEITKTSEMAPHFAKMATVDGRMSIKTPANGLPYFFMMGEFPKNLSQWRFVFLRRENLVRQAISGLIAQKTGQWTKRMEQKGTITEDDYSFDDILRLVNVYANGNRAIERFIGLLNLPTYNVTYEEFLADQKNILAEIAAFLGCDTSKYPEAKNHEPWLERQSTDLNENWEKRFREEILSRASR